MKLDKKRRLERAGWRVSTTAEFLGLDAQEQRLIDLKLALAAGIRRLRERRGLTQAALAKRLGSSQSRVAKLEAGDHSVSLDLMIRSLISVGAGPAEIARIIRRAEVHEAAYLGRSAQRQSGPQRGAAYPDARRRRDPGCARHRTTIAGGTRNGA
jgi:transcriptional regulator with XRE-family HTH domain